MFLHSTSLQWRCLKLFLLHSSAGHRTPRLTELDQQHVQAPPATANAAHEQGGGRPAAWRRPDWTQDPGHNSTSRRHQPCDGERNSRERAHDGDGGLDDVVLGLLHASTDVIHLLHTHARAHTAAPEGRLSKLAPACKQHCHQCVHVSQSVSQSRAAAVRCCACSPGPS